jgi:hypothetical protein
MITEKELAAILVENGLLLFNQRDRKTPLPILVRAINKSLEPPDMAERTRRKLAKREEDRQRAERKNTGADIPTPASPQPVVSDPLAGRTVGKGIRRRGSRTSS